LLRLAALATIDPLTQLANRRVLAERLTHEFARAKRYQKHLSCLMLDLDHFKMVNDTHGHPMGDKVLAEVGAAITSTIRNTDLGGRYGGEEFMIIAPETSLKQALILGERLRRAISFRTSQSPNLPTVTVSVGVASTEVAFVTSEDLVHRTDEALYSAKREGRDRVVAAT
jgi:diguanylate cyclase (GGDEF)-like protein